MGWPISRYQIRLALTRSGLTPLRKPHDIIMIDGSAVWDWCRFTVPLSHLACENLPMLIDRRTGQYASDEVRISQTIILAFTEPLSDMIIERERMRFLATFTIYIHSDRGRDTYQRRKDRKALAWGEWSALYR